MTVQTSETSPIQVAFLAPPSLPGRIGMTFAPGKHQAGKTATWRRDLGLDLARLRGEFGAGVLVCLLEAHELAQVKIGALPGAAWECGIAFWHFPVADTRVPRSLEATACLVEQICGAVGRGETVVIHCMGGLGRTGTIAAACLVALGTEPREAIAQVREARPEAIENPRQEDFVSAFGEAWQKLERGVQ
jgi:protein-tyrosine phosphatase